MSAESGAPANPRDRRVPVPVRQEVLKPIPDDVTPEVREFTETLRGLSGVSGVTLRRLAVDMHYSAGTVSRYLSGQRPPPREFVEKLLRICYDSQGAPVTAEVEQLVFQQRLAALKSSTPKLYEIELLNDRLALALTEKRACDNTVILLEQEIEQEKSQIYDLEREKRQILAAWEDERQRSDDAIAEEAVRRSSLEETIRILKCKVEQLNDHLSRALSRADVAEERCRELETQIDSASVLIEDSGDETPPRAGEPLLVGEQRGHASPATARDRDSPRVDIADYSEWPDDSVRPAARLDEGSIRIGLWGAPQSGKTTYLGALRHAVGTSERDYGRWTIHPLTRESSDLMVGLTRELTSGQFPASTLPGTHIRLAWMFSGDITKSKFVSTGRRLMPRRGRIESRFVLDLVDVSGDAYSDTPETSTVPRDSAHAALENLLMSEGLIYLFDPIRERRVGDSLSFVNRTILELKRKYYEMTGEGGPLPHQLSICVTKFDHPEIFREAQRNDLLYAGPGDVPRVRDEDAQLFFEGLCTGRFRNQESEHDNRSASFMMRELQNSFAPQKVKYFVTSSIGFYKPPGWRNRASFNPDDLTNYRAASGARDVIMGVIDPINVLEPLISLQQRIAGQRR
jgi:transcriptional regulator with XRE-family HTH domain